IFYYVQQIQFPLSTDLRGKDVPSSFRGAYSESKKSVNSSNNSRSEILNKKEGPFSRKKCAFDGKARTTKGGSTPSRMERLKSATPLGSGDNRVNLGLSGSEEPMLKEKLKNAHGKSGKSSSNVSERSESQSQDQLLQNYIPSSSNFCWNRETISPIPQCGNSFKGLC
ncbi:type-2 restriction enzyme AvaI, partial [Striga asiatica]